MSSEPSSLVIRITICNRSKQISSKEALRIPLLMMLCDSKFKVSMTIHSSDQASYKKSSILGALGIQHIHCGRNICYDHDVRVSIFFLFRICTYLSHGINYQKHQHNNYFLHFRRKRKSSDSVPKTKAPTSTEKSKKQRDNTKERHQKIRFRC